MGLVVYIDGKPFSPEAACISVFDRGFLYGDSIFETVRTYGGRPFALEEHLIRLELSAERVLIRMPVGRAVVADEVHRALADAANDESYLRIMITRGRGPMGLDPTEAEHPARVILAGPLEPPPSEAYANGVAVVTLRTQRSADATQAQGAKVANYLVAVIAIKKAREAGAHECLVVDSSDRVIEGASSNVFAVIGGELVTPPEADGPLLGITRSAVVDVARAEGIATVERSLPISELAGASELFISSSIREVLPVVSVDGRSVGAGAPGPVARRVHAALRKKINEIMELDDIGRR